MNKDKVSPVLN